MHICLLIGLDRFKEIRYLLLHDSGSGNKAYSGGASELRGRLVLKLPNSYMHYMYSTTEVP